MYNECKNDNFFFNYSINFYVMLNNINSNIKKRNSMIFFKKNFILIFETDEFLYVQISEREVVFIY